jgi:hypothetical protein
MWGCSSAWLWPSPSLPGSWWSWSLGEEAGDLERQRPYVEVLRLALAGHPAPQAALGMPQTVARAATIERMRSQISTCWELVHASTFDELGAWVSTGNP